MIGLACRMVVGLGLHLDEPGPGRMETETQMRRRLWHGCVQMETFVSMTLGRPPFFMTGNHVSLPDAVDDVYLPAQGEGPGQASHVFSQNYFTVINIKFTRILGMILRRIYHPAQQDTLSRTERPDVNTLLHLDILLQDVRKDIPAPIDWDCLPASNTAPWSSRHLLLRRQANVLQASFTSFCEAARPPVSPAEQTNQPVDSGLEDALKGQCAEVCVRYACELVESVSRATSEAATGAWWFSLFYLITSGVIIILAECTQLHKKPAFDGPTLARSWNLCITTLECLGAKHERAREYLQSLRILRERASQAYGVLGGQPPPATVQLLNGNVDGTQAARPEQRQAEGVCDTYEDVPWNSDAVYGTGFLEHDWGAPFLFENMGENWWEGQETSTCFPHEGELQDHIA
ncbi:fungal specific transcription factor domain-containing protein [Colletotrichum sojae]|uniref:Fungal specific transcription factor domain-containing protein n=1 Tax=Colletotrichum sojae TaxID=2175907 RepID=A0A8H6MRU3_9PEZI|nr:fungal specific transcription factor domain-containing protein [Colletotrichum sojae]